MELEFVRKGIDCLRPVLREPGTQEQAQELRLSDGMPDIGQVLASWGQVILRGKEWRTDAVSCSAGVMAWVLYAPENGSEPRILESWIPLQMKWNLETDCREGDILLSPQLRFLDARSVTARKIMLRCGLGILAEAFCADTIQIGEPGEMPADIQLLKRRYPVRLPKGAGEKTFSLEEKLSLSSGASDPEKLLAYTLEPRVTETRVSGDKLAIRGICRLHAICQNREGRIFSRDLEIPFSQLAELDRTYGTEARGDVRMALTSLEAELTPEGRILLKCGLVAQFLVDDMHLLELVEDAYSPGRQVEPRWEKPELPAILEQQEISVPVHQSIRQKARELADVVYLPDLPEMRRGDGYSLEMPGQFQVLYYDEGDMLRSATARTEENIRMDAAEESRMEGALLPGAVPGGTAGTGIELRAECILRLQTTCRQGSRMVTGLTVGEENTPDPARPSLILRRAGDMELWDIAKNAGSTVEAIRRANGLEAEPRQDQMLLIPVM